MTLTIEIRPEIEDKLRRRGMTERELANYVEHLIEEDNYESRTFAAKGQGASVIEKTYGSAGVIGREDLIALAEDEEFGGY
jgi:hypothetical protein